jgi:hypothetical protein
MKQPRRWTPQQKQSAISVADIEKLFLQNDWIPQTPKIDLGEDFLVQIYHDGNWTGLSVYVQLKSTDITIEDQSEQTAFSFGLEVKDILHWDVSVVPVFIFVWDIEKLRGLWISIFDVVKELDTTHPNWRQSKPYSKPTIHIPLTQSVDTRGLKTIQRFLANYFMKTFVEKYQDDLELELLLEIPNDDAGRAFLARFNEAQAKGLPIEIDGQYISEAKFSEWYRKMVGAPAGLKRLLLEPVVDRTSRPTRIELVMRNGKVEPLAFVDLKIERDGIEEGVSSNKHQPIAIHVTLTINKINHSLAVDYQLNNPGQNVQDTKNALSFMRAINTAERMRLISLKDYTMLELSAPSRRTKLRFDSEYTKLINRLVYIQRRLHVFLKLNDWTIPPEDELTINETYMLLKKRRVQFSNKYLTAPLLVTALKSFLEAETHEIDDVVIHDGYIGRDILGTYTKVENVRFEFRGRIVTDEALIRTEYNDVLETQDFERIMLVKFLVEDGQAIIER